MEHTSVVICHLYIFPSNGIFSWSSFHSNSRNQKGALDWTATCDYLHKIYECPSLISRLYSIVFYRIYEETHSIDNQVLRHHIIEREFNVTSSQVHYANLNWYIEHLPALRMLAREWMDSSGVLKLINWYCDLLLVNERSDRTGSKVEQTSSGYMWNYHAKSCKEYSKLTAICHETIFYGFLIEENL